MSDRTDVDDAFRKMNLLTGVEIVQAAKACGFDDTREQGENYFEVIQRAVNFLDKQRAEGGDVTAYVNAVRAKQVPVPVSPMDPSRIEQTIAAIRSLTSVQPDDVFVKRARELAQLPEVQRAAAIYGMNTKELRELASKGLKLTETAMEGKSRAALADIVWMALWLSFKPQTAVPASAPGMENPNIWISGQRLTQGQSMTLRVALTNFMMDMGKPGALGDDGSGENIRRNYLARGNEVIQMILKETI